MSGDGGRRTPEKVEKAKHFRATCAAHSWIIPKITRPIFTFIRSVIWSYNDMTVDHDKKPFILSELRECVKKLYLDRWKMYLSCRYTSLSYVSLTSKQQYWFAICWGYFWPDLHVIQPKINYERKQKRTNLINGNNINNCFLLLLAPTYQPPTANTDTVGIPELDFLSLSFIFLPAVHLLQHQECKSRRSEARVAWVWEDSRNVTQLASLTDRTDQPAGNIDQS